MSRRGPFNLNWPWGWLQGRQMPGAYTVPSTVLPVVDVGQHHTGIIGYREQFTMAVGLNIVVLPGFLRVATLNATFPPTVNGRGARRWLGLAFSIDTALVSGENVLFTYGGIGQNWVFNFLSGASSWGTKPYPIINGKVTDSGSNNFTGIQGSVYVPDPNFLFFSIANMAGGEVVTMSGMFLESDSKHQPLPSMFD